MKIESIFLSLVLIAGVQCRRTRESRLFNLFTPVQFENGPCTGTNGEDQGVCLTRTECNAEANSNIVGNCAAGEEETILISHTILC